MKGGGSQPSGALKDAIDDQFGGLDALKEKFNTAGANQFGSGWAWLIVGQDGKLAITSTPNQDNPLMDVAPVKGTPILGNDVWEHAYYITYRNARPAYLKAWWDVVDWDKVGQRYDAAVK
jgi:Fe-Mn family superoxide dismutase